MPWISPKETPAQYNLGAAELSINLSSGCTGGTISRCNRMFTGGMACHGTRVLSGTRHAHHIEKIIWRPQRPFPIECRVAIISRMIVSRAGWPTSVEVRRMVPAGGWAGRAVFAL